MKTLHQMFRQPVKTAAGIMMVTLAVAILITSVGQYTATMLTRSDLDDRYDTIALLSDEYFWESIPSGGRHHYGNLPSVYQEWVDKTIQTRTDLVQTESFAQLYSAYVPCVSPENFSQYENGDFMDLYASTVCVGNPYRCALLEVTLTAVGTVVKEKTVSYGTSMADMQTYREYITILCAGTVERTIGLEQGFASPVGKTITFSVCVYSEEELEALELEVGKRYLIYGMDYSDVQGEALQSRISMNRRQYEELYGAEVNELQIECYMSVCNYASLPVIYRNNGGFEVRTDLRQYSQRKEDGTVTVSYVSADEYMRQYSVPTIAKLSGTAEDYINSDDGALWMRKLEEMEINNHSFPVLAVGKLGYQVAFARGEARIVDGRDFTETERTQGAKVCVISEAVALLNGLSVGDTIDLQTCAMDPNIKVGGVNSMDGTRFPSAAFYSRTLGFTSEPQGYQIVGIYRQNNAWQNREDAYGFTPNVIFVPQDSISGDFKAETSGIFYTLVLGNGKMEEFQTLQKEAGYPELFICLDGGYSEIVAGLDAYEGVSSKALLVGIGGCVVIMLLFLVLFPCQQGKTLARMNALGTPRGKRIRHHLASALYLLLPGALLGCLAGVLLWEQVAATLMESVNVQIPLDANVVVLAPCLAAAAFLVAAIVSLLVAVAMSGSKGLMKRK